MKYTETCNAQYAKAPTELARTVLFYRAEYHILAKNMEKNSPVILDISDKTERKIYHYFAENDQNITKWSTIKVTTGPLSS